MTGVVRQEKILVIEAQTDRHGSKYHLGVLPRVPVEIRHELAVAG